jgi:hypothetical protein
MEGRYSPEAARLSGVDREMDDIARQVAVVLVSRTS